MLTPEYLDKLPDRVVELYSELEIRILEDMSRRIVKMEQFTDTALWQLWKLEQIGAEREFILSQLQRMTGKTQGEINALLEDASEETLLYDDRIYRAADLNPVAVAKSKPLQQVIAAGLKKTMRLFENLTGTTANTATRQFENTLDNAYMDVVSGAFSYQEAIRRAVKTLAGSGIDAIQYPTGHVDKMDVAVRRAVLTGVNQTAAQMQTARMEEMGCDLVETTAHAGARPSHAEWQGKVFSRSGTSKKYPPFSQTGYGTGPGLCGWNCRHSFFPYFEGLSKKTYNHKELTELNRKHLSYNGDLLTDYEASQIQRSMERNIRRWKREYMALSATGLDTSEASARLASWRIKQQDFLEQTGLHADHFRSQVEGFGRKQAAKARTEFQKTLLPQYRKAIIPKEKFTKYALNLEGKGKDKAIAFDKALGYNMGNADELIANIHKNLSRFPAKMRPETQYGQPFEVSMKLTGPNGKTAKVKTGWMVDKGKAEPRLVTAFVDKE